MSKLASSDHTAGKDPSKPMPIERYNMVFNNKVYGTLTFDPSLDKYTMQLDRNTPKAIRPSIIYGSVVMPETLKPDGYQPKSDEIYNWIKARSVPSNRQNIGDFLKENNLNRNDPWIIVKNNNGKCISDRWELYSVTS